MHVTPTEQEQRDEEHQPDRPPVNVRKKGASRKSKSAEGIQERGFVIVGVRCIGQWQGVSVSGATLTHYSRITGPLLTAISVGPRCGHWPPVLTLRDDRPRALVFRWRAVQPIHAIVAVCRVYLRFTRLAIQQYNILPLLLSIFGTSIIFAQPKKHLPGLRAAQRHRIVSSHLVSGQNTQPIVPSFSIIHPTNEVPPFSRFLHTPSKSPRTPEPPTSLSTAAMGLGSSQKRVLGVLVHLPDSLGCDHGGGDFHLLPIPAQAI
jgi:hypothetical protein